MCGPDEGERGRVTEGRSGGPRTVQRGMAFRPRKIRAGPGLTADTAPQGRGRGEPEAPGAPRLSVPKGWSQAGRPPSHCPRRPWCCPPGAHPRPPSPRPCPFLPEAAPSPWHRCIGHCPLAPGTAAPQTSSTPTAGGGRGKPGLDPAGRALHTRSPTGGAGKKTRSSDQPRDPRGTGTRGKPGADCPSGSAPGLLPPPPSLLPRAPLILQ